MEWGYKWLRDNCLKTLQEQMKGNEDIFVWLGVNDVYNISNYISLLNEEIPNGKRRERMSILWQWDR